MEHVAEYDHGPPGQVGQGGGAPQGVDGEHEAVAGQEGNGDEQTEGWRQSWNYQEAERRT